MATLTTEKGELKTKEDKKLIGSEFKEKLLNQISGVGQSIYERSKEDDPTSLSDEAARLGVGTAELVGNVAGAPVIKQTLSVLDFPFWVARQSAGGVLEHGFGVDPFYGQAAVGVGEVFLGGKGLVSGATKGAKLAKKGAFASRYAVQETVDAARAARLARKGKLWQRPGADNIPIDRSDVFKADDLSYGRGPNKKTYTQTTPRTVYPDPKGIPPDPWNPPDLQAHLFNYIDSTADVVPPANPSVDDILKIQEQLTEKRTSLLGEYTSRANIDMPQMMASGFGMNHVHPNPSQVYTITQKLLNEHVLIGANRVFDYNAFQALFTGNKRGRLLEGWMQTTPQFKIANWTKHRQELVDVFESIYGDVMQIKGIPRKQIHIDHLITLRSTMPLYDGVAFGSPLWNQIQETFLRSKNRYNPGNTLDNLDALDPGSHIVKTNFFNKRLGKNGEKFFTKKRLKYMKESDANRMEVLNDFIKIQDEGTLILREAQKVWETLYKIEGKPAQLPEDIINELSKIPVNEFSHPELRKKNLNQLRAIITDIVEEVNTKGMGKIKTVSEDITDTPRKIKKKYIKPTED